MSMDARTAVAEAWASIDGKLERFRTDVEGSEDGTREGYLVEADELLARIACRGFVVVTSIADLWPPTPSSPGEP